MREQVVKQMMSDYARREIDRIEMQLEFFANGATTGSMHPGSSRYEDTTVQTVSDLKNEKSSLETWLK